MAEWDRVDAQFAALPVAVNLSARNLARDRLRRVRRGHPGQSPGGAEPAGARGHRERPDRGPRPQPRHAAQARVLGVTLAVDDFGTGYTSMAAARVDAADDPEDRPLLRRPHGRRPRWRDARARRWSTLPTSSGSRSSPRESRTRRSPTSCGPRLRHRTGLPLVATCGVRPARGAAAAVVPPPVVVRPCGAPTQGVSHLPRTEESSTHGLPTKMTGSREPSVRSRRARSSSAP